MAACGMITWAVVSHAEVGQERQINEVEEDAFVQLITSKEAWLRESPESPYRDVLRAIADSPALHPTYLTPLGEPGAESERRWVPYVIANLLSLTVRSNKPTPPVETGAQIVARLLSSGEYELGGPNLTEVQPRKGEQFTLERKNWHPRDSRILFDDPSHSYHLFNDEAGEFHKFPGSVSSAYGEFFGHFDADECVRKFSAGWRAKHTSKYHAVARAVAEFSEERGDFDQEFHARLARIMTLMWDRKNRLDAASEKGTLMHLVIELYLNQDERDEARSIDRVDPKLLEHRGEVTLPRAQFEHFVRDVLHGEGLEPYRTEWSIHDPEPMLAGQIDGIFVKTGSERDEDGVVALHMIDWKRCNKKDLGPDQSAFDGKHGTGPCEGLLDTDFYHYAMQQNLYRAMLERQYGVRVKSMRLAQFHPTALTEYRIVDVPDLRHIVDEIIALRIDRYRQDDQEEKDAKRRRLADSANV